jgi:acetyl-CoA C-acetyltransferase
MPANPDRVPVIVGAGQINDRPADPSAGLNSLGLMEAALRAADADAGSGWLETLDSLAVVAQISFPDITDAAGRLARQMRLPVSDIFETAQASGDSPTVLLNRAADRIREGRSSICAVVGGEALRTAAQLAATRGPGTSTDMVRQASARKASTIRQAYGLTAPVDVYPLYEQACRAAWGQTAAEAQAESGEIWARFAEVAARSEGAWLRTGASAQDIVTVSAANRLVSFPYTKLMVANSSVNQGAGFIVTSLANARRRGVPESRIIHVGHGAAAHENADPLARDTYTSSPSLTASIRGALEANACEAEQVSHVELYSCFPCVPKMARRVLGWPASRPATVHGGLTFGGGPIGNYMSHAVAGMVSALRTGGSLGLLVANGGLATSNHAIGLSAGPLPNADVPRGHDMQGLADTLRGPVPPLRESHSGPAMLETFSATATRDGRIPRATAILRTPDGARTLAHVTDEAALAYLTDGAREPVGSAGVITPDGAGTQLWTPVL